MLTKGRTQLDRLFRSERMIAIFSDEHSLASMLRFEAALAHAEALLGVIPATAAAPIAACCNPELFDRIRLSEEAALAGNLAIPMVKQLTSLVRDSAPEAAGYVHWAATSQDVIDTALVLQLQEALPWFEQQLATLCEVLAALTHDHRITILAGRTWLQHAVPITFGLKTAGYLDAMLRHQERLVQLKPRVLTLQFGGAAGTLASLGDHGLTVARGIAEELKLGLPALPWHAHRDRISEVATFLGLLTGTAGKIARDLSLSMQLEVGEAAEAAGEGRGGSSTMPHKRNPVGAAVVLSAALRVPGLVATMLSSMVQENERGLGGWHAEWETLPEIAMLAAGALGTLTEMLCELEIFPDRMQDNLRRTKGLVLAEAVSMALAKKVGHDRAHQLMSEASKRALKRGCDLSSVLKEDAEIMTYLQAAEVDSLLNPALYLGSTQEMIDRVLRAHKEQSIRV